ncbi:DUF4238 domain-containing protein [Flavobacterium branchiicola]|uniref:DUF4238 domain-containing protein n=1 Tax=Flavobacterium branchiicola TaxID=1114875 RepID=A0ABV9PCD3_9FLAO|nr:DUF4238 domain-containing protein [Flavobacterium branchiicola]MBS7253319.1 DUF4238 domain-containing protein [Flavobacterium branchiicola]
MADLVKRQHFVPRTYLKHFSEHSGDKYFIHALPSQATEADKIFYSNITNVAFERHLYTLPGETIEQQMAVEKLYSEELEVHYDSIYEILTDPNKTEISSEERELIISTVVTMYYRTTKWVNASRNLMARAFESAYQLCEQTGVDYINFEGEKISIAGKTLQEFTREFNKERQPGMILIQLETAFKLIALRILNDSICVNKIDGENLEFVTSDNPVVASNNTPERFAPFDPTNILELPIDSKHKLMLIPECPKELRNRIFRRTSTAPFSEIEKLTTNYSQMLNSEQFIFGSKKALESYLATKQESERPIKDGESAADIFKKLKELGL